MSTTTTPHTQTAYKDTPIGKIPADWEVKRLGEIVKLSSGKTKPILNNGMGQYPVFGGNGIMGYSESYNYTGETVIIGRVGEYCGITRYVDEPCWITDNALYAKEIAEGVKPIYLAYKLQQLKLSRYRSKGGQPLISQTMINPISLPLPPLPEQKRIAEVLSTWDKAIQLTEQLIRQKEQRKKWLMQNLLTGKMRLKGFSGEWKEYRLKSICKISKGEQLNKIDLEKTGIYPSYSGGITPSGYTDKWNTNENTIIISEGGNSCGYVNYVTSKFWCGGHCYALLNLKEIIKRDFLFQALKHQEHKIMKLRVGSGLPNVQKKDLENYPIVIPSIEEQTAIAEVLQTADKEIELLKAKAEQLKEQKKGLMQQLLTGKKRLL